MVKADELYDITVVGAGPVGLYATYYSGLRECRTKLIETYPRIGRRLTSMYPEKEIFDVAGHRRIAVAPDMSTNLPGVYAAGDIVTYPGKILLITAGSGEAATAVNTAKEYILGDELGR